MDKVLAMRSIKRINNSLERSSVSWLPQLLGQCHCSDFGVFNCAVLYWCLKHKASINVLELQPVPISIRGLESIYWILITCNFTILYFKAGGRYFKDRNYFNLTDLYCQMFMIEMQIKEQGSYRRFTWSFSSTYLGLHGEGSQLLEVL